MRLRYMCTERRESKHVNKRVPTVHGRRPNTLFCLAVRPSNAADSLSRPLYCRVNPWYTHSWTRRNLYCTTYTCLEPPHGVTSMPGTGTHARAPQASCLNGLELLGVDAHIDRI